MVKVNSGEPEPISIVGAAGATDIPFVVEAEADVPAEKGAATSATRRRAWTEANDLDRVFIQIV
jgi:hypothetical protein